MYRTHVVWGKERFSIHSFGNGAAYRVVDEISGNDVAFQGDDAIRWRVEYDEAEDRGQLLDFLRETIADYGGGKNV